MVEDSGILGLIEISFSQEESFMKRKERLEREDRRERRERKERTEGEERKEREEGEERKETR